MKNLKKETWYKLGSFFGLFGSIYFVAWLAISRLPAKKIVDLYAPHKMCLAQNEQIIEVFQTGDMQTFISYMIIGSAFVALFFVLHFLFFQYRFWFFLTGFFVLSCGFDHLLNYLTMIDGGYYYYKGISSSVTGVLSMSVSGYTLMIAKGAARDAKNFVIEFIKMKKTIERIKKGEKWNGHQL